MLQIGTSFLQDALPFAEAFSAIPAVHLASVAVEAKRSYQSFFGVLGNLCHFAIHHLDPDGEWHVAAEVALVAVQGQNYSLQWSAVGAALFLALLLAAALVAEDTVTAQMFESTGVVQLTAAHCLAHFDSLA